MLNKPKNNKTSLTILFCFFILIPELVCSDPRPPAYYSNNPIVAEVDGEVIHLDDLKHVRIQEALVQLHQMKTRALKERVLEKLAKNHPEFSKKSNLKVSNLDIKNFYNNTPGMKDLGSLKQMSSEIKAYLRNNFRNI